MADAAANKKEEEKRPKGGGFHLPGPSSTPTYTSAIGVGRALPGAGLTSGLGSGLGSGSPTVGSGPISWLSLLLGRTRFLNPISLWRTGASPAVARGFLREALAKALANKMVVLMGGVVVGASVAGTLASYLESKAVKPNPSVFLKNPAQEGFQGPVYKPGYDNSLLLTHLANKGALEEGKSPQEDPSEEENKNTISEPSANTELAAQLAERMSKSQKPEDLVDQIKANQKQYGSPFGPYGSGGGFFSQGGPGGGPGPGAAPSSALKDAIAPGGGSGKASGTALLSRTAFGPRAGGSTRRSRSALDQLRNARAFSGKAAALRHQDAASHLSSMPFDATNPGGSGVAGGGTGITQGTQPGGGGSGGGGSGGGSGGGGNTGGGNTGTGSTSPNNPNPQSQQQQPNNNQPTTAPPPGPPKDVTPWSKESKLAMTMIYIAAGLLLAAFILKQFAAAGGWAQVAVKILAAAALAVSAVVLLMGLTILMKHGQMLQGLIYTISGGLLTIMSSMFLSGLAHPKAGAATPAAVEASSGPSSSASELASGDFVRHAGGGWTDPNIPIGHGGP